MRDRTNSSGGRANFSRGQVHTLEAFIAAMLIVSGVLFSLQATAVTPLTASTSNQHIENQQQAVAADLLSTAAENGTLRPAVTFWDHSNRKFVESSERGFYSNGGPPNDFGNSLNETFGDIGTPGKRIAYNVYVSYRRPDDSSRQQTMVYMGAPSDNAATATRTVALYDDTALSGPSDGTVSTRNFYAPDAAPDAALYNVVEVQIVVWQL